MIQAIVFDFGNVVGYFNHRLTTDRLLPHTDLLAEELHSRLFGGALEEDYEVGRISTSEFLQQARKAGRISCADDIVARAWADIFWPNKDVIKLLPLLKPRARLFLASNTNELHSRQFRGQFADALGHFEALILSHEVGARKPERAFYEHCLRRARCAAEECLLIDDLPANVAGARACGCQGIVFTGISELYQRLSNLGLLLR